MKYVILCLCAAMLHSLGWARVVCGQGFPDDPWPSQPVRPRAPTREELARFFGESQTWENYRMFLARAEDVKSAAGEDVPDAIALVVSTNYSPLPLPAKFVVPTWLLASGAMVSAGQEVGHPKAGTALLCCVHVDAPNPQHQTWQQAIFCESVDPSRDGPDADLLRGIGLIASYLRLPAEQRAAAAEQLLAEHSSVVVAYLCQSMRWAGNRDQ